MKILLININLSTKERYGKQLGKVGPTTEPLGLAYLAASIKKYSTHSVEIIDAEVSQYNNEDLINQINKLRPEAIGISILTPNYTKAIETINAIKESIENVKIIVGGPHVTIFPKETLEKNEKIDYGVIGEGEITIVELLNAIESKKNVNKVEGIVYRIKKSIKLTSPRQYIRNIDDIPKPARELLDMNKYKPAPTYYKRLPSYIILTTRGCPYRCSYCSKVFGSVYRFHSVERILEEINELITRYNTKEIIFRDDTFTVNKKIVTNLCNELINKGINKKIKWTCMTRVNLVDEEILQLMKRAGCWSIHYGIESGSQRLLDLIQKDITIEQIKNTVKWTKSAGIEVKAFFMIGLPTETKEETLQTLKFMKELDVDWVQVTITVPYPGTKLFEIAKSDGTLKSTNWEDYQTWAGWSNKELVYTPKGRNAEELKELQRKAMREFYLRPKFIINQLKNLKSLDNLKMYLHGAYALINSKTIK